MNKILMVVITILLLVVNFLSFHDIFEPHTLRDYLILFSSVLVFFYFIQATFLRKTS